MLNILENTDFCDFYMIFQYKYKEKSEKSGNQIISDGKSRKNIDFFEKVFIQIITNRLGTNLTVFRVAWKHLVNEDDALPYFDPKSHQILAQTQFIQFFYWKIK